MFLDELKNTQRKNEEFVIQEVVNNLAESMMCAAKEGRSSLLVSPRDFLLSGSQWKEVLTRFSKGEGILISFVMDNCNDEFIIFEW